MTDKYFFAAIIGWGLAFLMHLKNYKDEKDEVNENFDLLHFFKTEWDNMLWQLVAALALVYAEVDLMQLANRMDILTGMSSNGERLMAIITGMCGGHVMSRVHRLIRAGRDYKKKQ